MPGGNNIATLVVAGMLPENHQLGNDMVLKINALSPEEVKSLIGTLKKLGVTDAQAVEHSLQIPAY